MIKQGRDFSPSRENVWGLMQKNETETKWLGAKCEEKGCVFAQNNTFCAALLKKKQHESSLSMLSKGGYFVR